MPNIKKILWTDAEAKCPFFISARADKKSVSCEGFAEGLDVVLRFESIMQKDKHMGIFCVSRYEDCPMYRLTYDKKYKEAHEQ